MKSPVINMGFYALEDLTFSIEEVRVIMCPNCGCDMGPATLLMQLSDQVVRIDKACQQCGSLMRIIEANVVHIQCEQ